MKFVIHAQMWWHIVPVLAIQLAQAAGDPEREYRCAFFTPTLTRHAVVLAVFASDASRPVATVVPVEAS